MSLATAILIYFVLYGFGVSYPQFWALTLLSGQSVLPTAQSTDIYLASLGVLLTAVYIYGLIFRPKRQFFLLGIDSIVVLLFYFVGIVGLFTISGG